MTLEEFTAIEPQLANALCSYVGEGQHAIVDGVYRDGDRWTAHITSSGEFDIVVEARCHPNCRRGIGSRYIWCYADHVCCRWCIADPSHHYQEVHE